MWMRIKHDFHTAFDIKPTKVVYNVDLDMNNKKTTSVSLDTNDNNSAATVKMVKDLETIVSPYYQLCLQRNF